MCSDHRLIGGVVQGDPLEVYEEITCAPVHTPEPSHDHTDLNLVMITPISLLPNKGRTFRTASMFGGSFQTNIQVPMTTILKIYLQSQRAAKMIELGVYHL